MSRGQSKRMSLVESVLNVLIGLVVAVVAQIVVFPWFGIYIGLAQNLGIAAIFTVVSIARSYFVRRFFNWLDLAHRNWSMP